MPNLRHYKSKDAYMKSVAYMHVHGIKGDANKVVIAGKTHKVKHTRKAK